jgi:DNA-binding NarL/FixJ family response regulator
MSCGAPLADSVAMHSETIPSIFLVDDSPQVRECLKELFDIGARVRIVGEAGTVARAIADIKASQPDFVVLDYQLPDGTGLDVLRELRDEMSRTRFIVLTNHASSELQQAFLDAGAQCLLDKSHDFQRLSGLVAELV